MRVTDPSFVHSSNAHIALMNTQLNGKAEVSFADLRANVQQFANFTDGELAQIAQDAGYTVRE